MSLHDKLKAKYKRKFTEALKWILENDRISQYIIGREDTQEEKNVLVGLSAVVKGEHDKYVVDISFDKHFCNCLGSKSHKTVCKHIIYLALYSFFKGKISSLELEKLLLQN